PGRDITRLSNRAARVLLFMFVSWAAPQLPVPAWSQSAPAQNDAQPAPADPQPAPTPQTQDKPLEAQDKPAQAPDKPASPATTQDQDKDKGGPDSKKKETQDKDINDQGVFVFRKDVDEVLLHASVVDDKQHIITTLDRSAFTIFED